MSPVNGLYGIQDARTGQVSTDNDGALLIIAIMAVFALLGSVEGWSEATLGFYGLIVPLALALGFDRMVAVAAIMLSSGIGVLCSTVNPFAIGVASSAADISIGDGIVPRALMLVVLTAFTIFYVLHYAGRVRTDPGRGERHHLGDVLDPGVHREPAAGVPDPVHLWARHPGDADHGSAGRLRERAQVAGRHRVVRPTAS